MVEAKGAAAASRTGPSSRMRMRCRRPVHRLCSPSGCCRNARSSPSTHIRTAPTARMGRPGPWRSKESAAQQPAQQFKYTYAYKIQIIQSRPPDRLEGVSCRRPGP